MHEKTKAEGRIEELATWNRVHVGLRGLCGEPRIGKFFGEVTIQKTVILSQIATLSGVILSNEGCTKYRKIQERRMPRMTGPILLGKSAPWMVTSLEASKPRTSDGKPRHHTQQQRHSLQKETAANLAAIFRLRYIPQPTIHKCECSMDTSECFSCSLSGGHFSIQSAQWGQV